MHRSQAALLLLQVAHFFGPEETSFEVQEVSWLLWTGVFRGAAPVVQACPLSCCQNAGPALAAGLRGCGAALEGFARAIDAPRAAAA